LEIFTIWVEKLFGLNVPRWKLGLMLQCNFEINTCGRIVILTNAFFLVRPRYNGLIRSAQSEVFTLYESETYHLVYA
jgi:hypothetical protein